MCSLHIFSDFLVRRWFTGQFSRHWDLKPIIKRFILAHGFKGSVHHWLAPMKEQRGGKACQKKSAPPWLPRSREEVVQGQEYPVAGQVPIGPLLGSIMEYTRLWGRGNILAINCNNYFLICKMTIHSLHSHFMS